VGASDKVGPGLNAWLTLERIGYAGVVHFVTPSRAELFGRRTYPTLDAIPDSIDAVFIAVPQAAVVDAVRAGRSGGSLERLRRSGRGRRAGPG
jgi:acetate---CoA ligase (ADP-forming)